MFTKFLKYKSVNERQREDSLVHFNRSGYEIIAPHEYDSLITSVKRNKFNELWKKSPVKGATFTVAGTYIAGCTAMIIYQNRHNLLKPALLASGALVAGAVGGSLSYIIDRIDSKEKLHEQFTNYTDILIKLERNISEEISDDTRVVRKVFMYRRDLFVAKKAREAELQYKYIASPIFGCEYSEKSKKQLMNAICAEFGNIHEEFVDDLRKSNIYSISEKQIMIDVIDQTALERIKASSKRIDEVFAVFGLVPIFFLPEALSGTKQ